jgi:hypothetical protein
VPRAFAPQAAPTVSSPTTVVVQPGAAVNVNPPPGTPTPVQTPPAIEKKPEAAEPAAPVKQERSEKPATFNPFDLSSYESVLSRITGGSRQAGTPGAPEAAAKPAGERQ